MNEEQFLERIRTREGLRHAVLNRIEADRSAGEVAFFVLTDAPFTAEDEQFAAQAVREAVPACFEARLELHKTVADPSLVRRKILEYLASHHRAAAACIRAEDIDVQMGDPVSFTFAVDDAERTFFERNEGVIEGIERMLGRNFCNTFAGGLRSAVKEEQEVEEEGDEPVFDDRPVRSFPVTDFEPIDLSDAPRMATYIADCKFASDSITVCGEITHMIERVSQKGKPYIRFTLSDKTGVLSFSYFIKKKTEKKIRELKPGDFIVCTGANELYNERLSYTARYINRGAPPKDFEPVRRKSRAVPAHYTCIRPEKIVDYNQINLFEQATMPPDLVENTFVVFDLETTGLVNNPAAGRMDAITEIGAVKIEKGEIREKFSTLVDPQRKLEEQIVKLTGITDDMLVGQPKIEQVIPDFFKFCDGCILVGHNVQFDYQFIRYYGSKDEYMFENRALDTMTLAQELLFLPNYKLNTLADHYGISFNHHRAWDDALTTAKIFIELIKAKKCLPTA